MKRASGSKLMVQYDAPIGVGLTRQAGSAVFEPVKATLAAGGQVRVPLEEYQMGASYTFEYEAGGLLYRWQGATPHTIEVDAAVFDLAPCGPVVT